MADDNEILTDIEIEIESSLQEIEQALSEFNMINVEGEPAGQNIPTEIRQAQTLLPI